MATGGKLDVEIEVKSPADKFWGAIRDSTSLFPKAFSHDYKSIEVLEGDGKAPGSIRRITYAEGKIFLILSITYHIRSNIIALRNQCSLL